MCLLSTVMYSQCPSERSSTSLHLKYDKLPPFIYSGLDLKWHHFRTPSSYIVCHYSVFSDHSGFGRALSHALPQDYFSRLKSPSLHDLSLLTGKLFQISDQSSSFVEPSPILLHPFRDVGPELHNVQRLMAAHGSFWEAQWYPLFCAYFFPYSYKRIKLALLCLVSSMPTRSLPPSSQPIILYMKIQLFLSCCITSHLFSSAPAVFLAPVINYLFFKTISKVFPCMTFD